MSKESIKEIDSRLKAAEDTEREQLMRVYAPDDRAGVQKLLEKYRKQKEKLPLPLLNVIKIKPHPLIPVIFLRK